MCLELGTTPLVLISPAWWAWRVRPQVRTKAVVIHSPDDSVVPFSDSELLCKLNPGVRLIPAGQDHRMNDRQAKAALREAVAHILGTVAQVGRPRVVTDESLASPGGTGWQVQ